jgi:hypothetical protein
MSVVSIQFYGGNPISLNVAVPPAGVAQIIELATGIAPTSSQLAAWLGYESSGGPIASIASAFSASVAFANIYNTGTPVDPNSPITSAIAQGIIEHALGAATNAEITAWASTGLSVGQVFQAFALGDQYTAAQAAQNNVIFSPISFNPMVALTSNAPFTDTGHLTGGTTAGATTLSEILFPTITGAAPGDQIIFDNAENEGLANLGGGSAEVNMNAVSSVAGALDLATADATASGPGFLLPGQTGLIDWFQFSGDTYIVEAVNPTLGPQDQTALGPTDVVIKLVGLVDLSNAQFSSATHTLSL